MQDEAFERDYTDGWICVAGNGDVFVLVAIFIFGIEFYVDAACVARGDGAAGPGGHCAAARCRSIADEERHGASICEGEGMGDNFSFGNTAKIIVFGSEGDDGRLAGFGRVLVVDTIGELARPAIAARHCEKEDGE